MHQQIKEGYMVADNHSNEDSLTTHYLLEPGYIIVPDHSVCISTVIGSGVSICIFDREKKIGGMNHFIFPYTATRGKTTALYGNIATITLLKMMLTRGSLIKSLEAQIYGGAYHPEKNNNDVARENVEIARKILLKKQVPITSQDVGGEKGRKVIFNTKINEVAILKVDRLRDKDWYPYQ